LDHFFSRDCLESIRNQFFLRIFQGVFCSNVRRKFDRFRVTGGSTDNEIVGLARSDCAEILRVLGTYGPRRIIGNDDDADKFISVTQVSSRTSNAPPTTVRTKMF
jgi:hypothetical protein